MAFVIRTLRIICKNNNVFCNSSKSTSGKPSIKLKLMSASQQKSFYSSEMLNICQRISDSQPTTLDKIEKEKHQKKYKYVKWGFLIIGTPLIISGCLLLHTVTKDMKDKDGNKIKDEFSNLPFHKRSWGRLREEINFYKKWLIYGPSQIQLLPEPLVDKPKYTIVIEMKDFLVHREWTYRTGTIVKKRPGVDQFLEQLSPNFEIVVYTAAHKNITCQILDKLDPNSYINFRLFYGHTRLIYYHLVKDLDALNRDLSKVIVIDWNLNNVQLHPKNALILTRWYGNNDDTTLYHLTAFLKMIHATDVDDVREVIAYYRQFDNPLEKFRENQRKLLQHMEDEKMKKQQRQDFITLASRQKISIPKPRDWY